MTLAGIDCTRNRFAQRLANAALALATPTYRAFVEGAIRYGMNAAAADERGRTTGTAGLARGVAMSAADCDRQDEATSHLLDRVPELTNATDHVLAMINGTLADFAMSDDAMRWSPERADDPERPLLAPRTDFETAELAAMFQLVEAIQRTIDDLARWWGCNPGTPDRLGHVSTEGGCDERRDPMTSTPDTGLGDGGAEVGA